MVKKFLTLPSFQATNKLPAASQQAEKQVTSLEKKKYIAIGYWLLAFGGLINPQ
jgi:hypothetical protein